MSATTHFLHTVSSLADSAGDILASAPTTVAPAGGAYQSTIETSPLWANVVRPLAAGLGAFLVVAGIFKIASQVLGGRQQGAMKTGVLTVIGGAILFNIGLVFNIISVAGTAVTALIQSISSLIGGG